MKTHINLFTLICLGIAVIFLSGMEGCGKDETPVTFIEAVPEDGSIIQKYETIIVTFDGEPIDLNVTGADFSVAGSTVTIEGPFTPGTLTLVITWGGGATALTYAVEPDIPPSPEGMVLIPAGDFEMGSNDEEEENDEQPVHTVYVDAFYMDAHEVTNLEYKKFLLDNPRWQKGWIEHRFDDGDYLRHWNGNDYPDGKANDPVIFVSWYAAMAYAQWADKRLPTEAEWEYAARGGLQGKKYPNGNTITPRDANYGSNVGDTTPVEKYPKNGYGLFDMAGNVWEWCLDEYEANFYFVSPHANPLSGANSVEWIIDNFTSVKGSRVLRGGSWYGTARFVRVANRVNFKPSQNSTM